MTAGLESESSGSDEDSSGQGDLRAYMRQQLEVPKSHDIKEQDQQRETDATSDEDSNNDVTDSGKPLNSKARERRLNRKKRSRSVRFAFDEVETIPNNDIPTDDTASEGPSELGHTTQFLTLTGENNPRESSLVMRTLVLDIIPANATDATPSAKSSNQSKPEQTKDSVCGVQQEPSIDNSNKDTDKAGDLNNGETQYFDTTYLNPNDPAKETNETFHFGTTTYANSSDLEDSTLAETQETQIEGEDAPDGVQRLLNLGAPIPRSEITVCLININCANILAQDFKDIVTQINNVKVFKQHFVFSQILLHGISDAYSTVMSSDSKQTMFTVVFYDNSETKHSLNKLSEHWQKLQTWKNSMVLCGLTPEGMLLDFNYDISIFALKSNILHRPTLLTFADVSKVLQWAIRVKLDSNTEVVPVSTKLSPASPTHEVLISDKHFDILTSPDNIVDECFKVCLIGPSKCGKTQIGRRFTSGVFQEGYQETIGVDFSQKTVQLERKVIKVEVWDFGGRERFQSIVCSYLEKMNCVIAVYDAGSETSLQKLSTLLEYFQPQLGNKLIVLAAAKLDLGLKLDPNLESPEIDSLIEQYNASGLFKVSSKTGQGVENMFVDCCIMMQNMNKRLFTHQAGTISPLGARPESETKSVTCQIL